MLTALVFSTTCPVFWGVRGVMVARGLFREPGTLQEDGTG